MFTSRWGMGYRVAEKLLTNRKGREHTVPCLFVRIFPSGSDLLNKIISIQFKSKLSFHLFTHKKKLL